MKKKIITVVAGILAIILIVVVSEHSQDTTSHHDSNVSASKWTKKSFDKLKIGDFNKNQTVQAMRALSLNISTR